MMKMASPLAFGSIFLFFVLARAVRAANEAPADQFLGSPLLVLAALLIIAGLAIVYHRIRK
jgi:membrane protease YdiL (CAAX protease family)